MRDLGRLLRPRSVAVMGGVWAANVAAQLQRSGFEGEIWPVHPSRTELAALPCHASISALPAAPDAAFVAVRRETAVDVMAELSARGAGGAICFAAGFSESEAEGSGGLALQQRLVAAAGAMPLIGPNCYGFVNYLDHVALWPDQHGGVPVERGVAIIAQSSNVAINLTMQARGLPLALIATAGNQAQTGVAEIASALLDDPRITAIGLLLEGFGDLRALEDFAARAETAAIPVVVLKAGRSDAGRAAGLTHTALLSGNAAAASALIRRLGFTEVTSLGVFLETLALLDAGGPLPADAIASVSCSGGEAGLMADGAEGSAIRWRALTPDARARLRGVLGPLVTLANPLDYHTYIWGDVVRMTQVFAAVMADGFDLTVFVLDLPRTDRCDQTSYRCAIEAIIAARAQTGARVAVLCSLPENLPETAAAEFAAAGIVALHGMTDGLAAIDAAICAGRARRDPRPLILTPPQVLPGRLLDEAQAKTALAAWGLPVPRSIALKAGEDPLQAAAALRFPLVLKATGIAHKTEAGAVRVGLANANALSDALSAMPDAAGFMIEEMASGAVAEILAGISRDPTGALILTLGAGGTLAELLDDTAHLTLPTDDAAIRTALLSLRIGPLLAGYRNRPAADLDALVAAVLAICAYAGENAARLIELDVNPIIARAHGAIAVDALIHLTEGAADA